MTIDAAVRHLHLGNAALVHHVHDSNIFQTRLQHAAFWLAYGLPLFVVCVGPYLTFSGFPIRSQVDHWRTQVFFVFCNFCSSCLIARNTKKKWFDHEASLLLALLWHASWFKTQLAHTTSPSTNCRPIAQSYLLDLQDFARTLASFFAMTWLSLFFHPSWDFDPIWSIWLLCASMWVRPTKLKPYQCILQFLPVPSNSIPYATQRPEPMGR